MSPFYLEFNFINTLGKFDYTSRSVAPLLFDPFLFDSSLLLGLSAVYPHISVLLNDAVQKGSTLELSVKVRRLLRHGLNA